MVTFVRNISEVGRILCIKRSRRRRVFGGFTVDKISVGLDDEFEEFWVVVVAVVVKETGKVLILDANCCGANKTNGGKLSTGCNGPLNRGVGRNFIVSCSTADSIGVNGKTKAKPLDEAMDDDDDDEVEEILSLLLLVTNDDGLEVGMTNRGVVDGK